jgi:phosphohistidine phosphatase
MDIYVIRHGKAEDNSATGLDRDRVLRKKGHKQAAWIADVLAQRDPRPKLVLSSPYVRAMETAEPIWAAIGMQAQVDDRLGAERSMSDALDVLLDARGSGCVALVGHNPNCARLVSTLCNGLTTMPGGHRTGELAHIRIESDELIGGGVLIERLRMGDDD